MPFLRQSYKQKPQARGPVSDVQASIFKNAERTGIDPASIALAMPMWERAGLTATDFSKNRIGNTFNAGPDWYAGNLQYRLGYADYINLGTTAALQLQSHTIISSIYPYLSYGNPIFARESIISDGFEWYLGVANYTEFNGKIAYTFFDGSVRGWYIFPTVLPALTSVYTLGLVWDKTAGLAKCFVNSRKPSADIATTTGTITHNANRSAYIGARTYNSDVFKGEMHFFWLFNVALPDSQIAYLSDNPYFLLQRVAPVYYSVPLSLNLTQYAFRFRNDDGYESLQSVAGAVFLRRSYKQKPQASGPVSAVQASIFKNAESMPGGGINPASIALAMPMWEGAGTTVYDYSKNAAHGVITGALWEKNYLNFGEYTSAWYVSISSLDIINLPESKLFTTIFRCNAKYLPTDSAFIAWGGTDDLLFYPLDRTTKGIRVFWRNTVGSITSSIDCSGQGFITYAASFDIGTQKLYQKGVNVANATNSLSGAGPFNSFRIGSWADGSQDFDGKGDFVYLFSVALPPSQIAYLSDNPYYLLQRVAPVTFSIPKPAATYAANENTNITLTPGSKTRIRIGIDATGDPTSKQFQLEYRHKPSGGSPGAWGAVT